MHLLAPPHGRASHGLADRPRRSRPRLARPHRPGRGTIIGLFAAMLLLAPNSRGGEPSIKDRKNALVAFEQGRALMAQGRTEEACGRFDEAMKLHPRVGYALNLAECEEKRGRLTVASEQWAAAAALAEQTRDNRLGVARDRAQKLDARLPRLTVSLAESAPADSAVSILGGTGEPSDWTALGTPKPIDPGSYRFVVRAKDREDGSFEVNIAESDRAQLEVAPGPPIVAIPVEAPPVPAPEPDESPWDLKWSDWRTAGVAVGVTGIVSLGVGTALGVIALNRRDDAEPHCNDRNICDADGVALREQAFNLAHGSTATLIGGGVLLAGGAVLFFVPELVPDEPEEQSPFLDDSATARARSGASRPSVRVSPTAGGIVVFGQW